MKKLSEKNRSNIFLYGDKVIVRNVVFMSNLKIVIEHHVDIFFGNGCTGGPGGAVAGSIGIGLSDWALDQTQDCSSEDSLCRLKVQSIYTSQVKNHNS